MSDHAIDERNIGVILRLLNVGHSWARLKGYLHKLETKNKNR